MGWEGEKAGQVNLEGEKEKGKRKKKGRERCWIKKIRVEVMEKKEDKI